MQLKTIIMVIHVPVNSTIYSVLKALVKYIWTSKLYPMKKTIKVFFISMKISDISMKKTIKEKWQKIFVGKYNITRNEQASIKRIQNISPSKQQC